MQIDGTRYEADFVKVALNVVRLPGEARNRLPEVLRGWFGPDAGLPGTRHEVVLEQAEKGWRLRPAELVARVLLPEQADDVEHLPTFVRVLSASSVARARGHPRERQAQRPGPQRSA